MAVTRSEIKEIIRLANQVFDDAGMARRFLKQSWDGIVAAQINQGHIETLRPIDFIHDTPDGAEKVKTYLQGRIERAQTPPAALDMI